MKTKNLRLGVSLLLLTVGVPALANVDPATMKLKVYQVAVAADDDCSSPQVLFTSSTGTEFDFLTNPVLGSGTLANGAYNCIMITMDDVLKFRPAQDILSGPTKICDSTQEYAIDLCRNAASSGGFTHFSRSDVLMGTSSVDTECLGTSQQVGSGGVANKVTLYLRTSAPAITDAAINYVATWKKGITLQNAVDFGGGDIGPSINTSNGIQLSSAFVVSGTKTGVFYVDATGQVSGNSGTCEMGPPEFGFRNP